MEFIARYISVAAVDWFGDHWVAAVAYRGRGGCDHSDRPAMHDVCGRRRGQVFSRGTGSAAPLDHM